MAITPDEIANKEFLVGLRGYDKDEVRAFLHQVADAFSTLSTAPPPVPATPEGIMEPTTYEPAVAAPVAPTASTATGSDWAELGEEIAAVLRTAHEQAAGLRADAEAEARATRQQAETDAAGIRSAANAAAEATRAAAEQDRAEAATQLNAAQAEALGLVADAQNRVDSLIESSRQRAKDEAEASVAHLTSHVTTLSETREHLRVQLNDLRGRLDKAITTVESD